MFVCLCAEVARVLNLPWSGAISSSAVGRGGGVALYGPTHAALHRKQSVVATMLPPPVSRSHHCSGAVSSSLRYPSALWDRTLTKLYIFAWVSDRRGGSSQSIHARQWAACWMVSSTLSNFCPLFKSVSILNSFCLDSSHLTPSSFCSTQTLRAHCSSSSIAS